MTTHEERLQWLVRNIEYEFAGGVHTYSQCDCGRTSRTGLCVVCMVTEFCKENKNGLINADDQEGTITGVTGPS